MTAEQRKQELLDEFIEFSAEYPRKALGMVAGLLVGLLEHQVEEAGGDPALEIKIEGGGECRAITISAKTKVNDQAKGD